MSGIDNNVRKVQNDHFSGEKSAHVSVDSSETEKYAEKVANNFHKRRRQVWWDNYKINYKNRQKDQAKARKHDLD